MAKQFNYKSQIEQGEVIQSWHVSQSVDAFSTANQVAYDISVSGSFKATSSVFIQPDVLPQQSNSYILSYNNTCLLYTSPSPRDRTRSRMPSSA